MTGELPQEPEPGGDPTRVAPGVGPESQDPLTAAITEPAAGAEPAPTGAGAAATHAAVPRATNAGRLWISIAVATILLVLLIIFIAENSRSVKISFLGAHGHISLALALLIAAVVGVLVTLAAGTARILQLRGEVRRHRRAASLASRQR